MILVSSNVAKTISSMSVPQTLSCFILFFYYFFYTPLWLLQNITNSTKQAIAISKFYLVFLSMQNLVLFLLSWASAQYCISDTRYSRVLLTWRVLPASYTGMQMSINDSLRHATRGILATYILQWRCRYNHLISILPTELCIHVIACRLGRKLKEVCSNC